MLKSFLIAAEFQWPFFSYCYSSPIF